MDLADLIFDSRLILKDHVSRLLSLPPQKRSLLLCDDIIARLENAVDNKRPGPILLQSRQLALSVSELGYSEPPIRISRIEDIGEEVTWVDPDGMRRGFMLFNIKTLVLVSGDWGKPDAVYRVKRGGYDVTAARRALIEVLVAWKQVLSFTAAVELAPEDDTPTHTESFDSVVVDGESYPLGEIESAVIRRLWQLAEQNVPDASARTLEVAVVNETGKGCRVWGTFRNENRNRKLVRPVGDGRIALTFEQKIPRKSRRAPEAQQ